MTHDASPVVLAIFVISRPVFVAPLPLRNFSLHARYIYEYRVGNQRHEYIDHELVLSSSQARASLCECNSPYADAIGYCRCVAPRLACDPSFKFRDALLADLAAKERSLEPGEHLRFQFARDIRDNPALREAAESVVLQAREGSVSIGGGMGMVAKTGEGGRADGESGPSGVI